MQIFGKKLFGFSYFRVISELNEDRSKLFKEFSQLQEKYEGILIQSSSMSAELAHVKQELLTAVDGNHEDYLRYKDQVEEIAQ